MYSPIKERLLRWLEPYREIRASEMLAWRVFAQAHNAAGKWPPCAISPYEKVTLVDDEEVEPDYLRKVMGKE